MGMIDAEELFAAFAHLTLSGEEILRRSFVGNNFVDGDITKRVDAFSLAIVCATNQTATLSRICFTSVGKTSDRGVNFGE